ncbi:NUDIX domain-containing protein [Halorubrum sp. SD626R]|uniref:NUDIX domain-containing protein n=1 Tax=Halorubrum sp. SD626R TaxID=1419722 RepID=UPI0013052E98|nr:NUDIX hydrolase [Halorubrum sp. SD626R]
MPTPQPAVKALIEYDGQYLLLKHVVSDQHLWTLPGGKVEFDESPTEAVRREVDEEVSLTVDVGSPVGIYDFQFDNVHIVATVITCSVLSEPPCVDTTANPADETIFNHEWVTKKSGVSDRPMNDGLAQVLASL